MNRLLILLAAFAASPALAQGMLMGFGRDSADTGYAVHSETMQGGARRVDAYDWVCPAGSSRPAGGLVELAPQSEAATSMPVITLGPRQCYDYDAQQVTDMVKQYRQGYYVVGGKAGDLQGAQQGAGAAAAASAAGAAAGGFYAPCTPNPIALCSGGEPGPYDPMRACYLLVCPHGR